MRRKYFIREWAERQEKEAQKRNDITPEALFGSMIYALSTFARCKDLENKNDDMAKLYRETIEEYSGDSTLFEIGCYFYYRVDLWIFKHKPKFRDNLSSILIARFIDLFTQALKIKNIEKLINERMTKYGEMIRKGEKIERYHDLLIDLVKRTKENTPPQHFNFKKSPFLIIGVLDEYFLRTELIGFEKYIIVSFFKTLENYFDYLKKI